MASKGQTVEFRAVPLWASFIVVDHRCSLSHGDGLAWSADAFWASTIGVATSFAAYWGGVIKPVSKMEIANARVS